MHPFAAPIPSRLLPETRARLERSPAPREALDLAWSEYRHGHPGRAKALLRSLSPQPASGEGGLPELSRLLLASRVRSLPPSEERLRRLADHSARSGDRETRLVALGSYLWFLAALGAPPGSLAGQAFALAGAARDLAPGLVPGLSILAARLAFDAGEVAAMERAARSGLEAADADPNAAAALGHLVAISRLLGAANDVPPVPDGLDRLLDSRLRLLEARAWLRCGGWERARDSLAGARLRAGALRSGGFEASCRILDAELAAASGDFRQAEAMLHGSGPHDAGSAPGAWRRALVRARIGLSRNRLREGKASLEAIRDDVAEHAAGPLTTEFEVLETRLARVRRGRSRIEGPAGGPPMPPEGARVGARLLAERLLDPRACRHALLRPMLALRSDPEPSARRLLLLARSANALRRGRFPAAARLLGEASRWQRADTPDRRLAIAETALRAVLEGRTAPLDAAQGPTGLRDLHRLLAYVTRNPPRAVLVTRDRRIPLAEWDLARIRAARDHQPLWVDVEAREAFHLGAPLDLRRRPRLFSTLVHLLGSAGVPQDAATLVRAIWGRRYVPYETDHLVHTTISRLRRRLPDQTWIRTEEARYSISPDLEFLLLLPSGAGTGQPIPMT